MKFASLLSSLILISNYALATNQWQFGNRVAITPVPVPGVFHHLEGAGRKHIAASESHVAVAWEDNSTTEPQVYLAIKTKRQAGFSNPIQVSNGQEAYEPAITAAGKDQFLVAWEQDGDVYIRIIANHKPGDMVKLSSGSASHASITSLGDEAYVVWREQKARKWSLWVARLKLSKTQMTIQSKVKVEQLAHTTPVLYPAISVTEEGVCVAWEDRRAGHTRLLVSFSAINSQHYSEPENLNEFYSDRNDYDKGSGVTRVSIAAYADDEVVTAWMDKRRRGGYGIFASLGAESGASFGPNERVHGKKGDKQPHYNPATAGNTKGQFVIVWDDYRNGNSDIWLSTVQDEDDEWSPDYAPKVASSSTEESHPAIALDEDGLLHLLWMERGDLNSPSQLWYSMGVPTDH